MSAGKLTAGVTRVRIVGVVRGPERDGYVDVLTTPPSRPAEGRNGDFLDLDNYMCEHVGMANGQPTRAPRPERANKLYYGDNLDVLRKHVKDESVDLCYMDPPFNSKRNYNQIYNNVGSDDLAQAQAFIDMWQWDDHSRAAHREILANEQGRFPDQLVHLIRGLYDVLGRGGSLFAYLVGMSLRIVEVYRVLKPTGSFYFHCDPTASHYLKLIIDSVFCSQGGDFGTEIVWKRSTAHSDTKQGRALHGHIHDAIFFYTKTDQWTWNPIFLQYDKSYVDSKYRHIEEGTGRRYRKGDLTAAKPGGDTSYSWKGVKPYGGRYWAFSREKMEGFDREGRLVYTKTGMPEYKRYLDEMPGVPLQDVWTDIDPINSQAAERLGYPTQKPISLLERILLSSSNENDVVLDPCCGCGTTIAAAEQHNRKWIGVDITYQAIAVILKRLEDQAGETWLEVEKKIALGGIPRDMASAVALAHKEDDRVRKEFEKWAVLTYTKNRGLINEKKGADGGIDGRVHFLTSATENATMILQVKSGIVERGDISRLLGDMQREGAAMGTLITLAPPTQPMIDDAKKAGEYHHDLMDRDYDRIQIVTIKEIIEDRKRLDLPLVKDFSKQARRTHRPGDQPNLPGIDGDVEAEPPVPAGMLDYARKIVEPAMPAPMAAEAPKPKKKRKKKDE